MKPPTFTRQHAIDSHCHLDFSAFDTDRQIVMERAYHTGITDIINPATQSKYFAKIAKLTQTQQANSPRLHAAYGLHPYFITQHHPDDLRQLESWIQIHPTVAIGECGLDLRHDFASFLTKQQFYFRSQLTLAKKYDLPVIIHAQNAVDLVHAEIRKIGDLRGVIHSFSGSLQQAQQLIKQGFYLGIGGTITFSRAKRLHNIVTKLPLNNLLIESDAPDQAPAIYYRQRNEPCYLQETAQHIALLKNLPIDVVLKHTADNARHLFHLTHHYE